MKKVVLLLSLLALSACSDRYRNPADDPRNQTSTTSALTETTVVP